MSICIRAFLKFTRNGQIDFIEKGKVTSNLSQSETLLLHSWNHFAAFRYQKQVKGWILVDRNIKRFYEATFIVHQEGLVTSVIMVFVLLLVALSIPDHVCLGQITS